MRAKFLILISALVMALPAFGQSGYTKKVAILETVDKKGAFEYEIKLMIRSLLTDTITSIPGYEGFDRVDVASIMSEHEFQRTGLVSADQIKRLGEMTGADYILVAETVPLGDTQMLLVAKILNVETGKIDKNATVRTVASYDDLETACNTLADKLFNIERGRTIIL